MVLLNYLISWITPDQFQGMWNLEINLNLYHALGKFSRRQIDIFSYFSLKKKIWYFVQVVFSEESLLEMSNPVLWEK